MISSSHKRKLLEETEQKAKNKVLTRPFQYIQSLLKPKDWAKQEYENMVSEINSSEPFLL